jgi:hypothetical protein
LVVAVLLAGPTGAGCGIVDLGDNPVPPMVVLDEDFFYCRVQPEVIATYRCSSGDSGMGDGACHGSHSFELDPLGETDPPPPCDGNVVVGPVPASYMNNFITSQVEVGPTPAQSEIHERPTRMRGHPRVIFAVDSDPQLVIREWILMGTP